jgi:hypothetical protein
MLQLAKHVHAKFQLSSFYPDGLGQIFDYFQVNFRIFSRKFQNFPFLKKVVKKASQKAFFTKTDFIFFDF